MNAVSALTTMPKSIPSDVRRQTIFEPNVPISKMFVAFRDEIDGYARPLNEGRAKKVSDAFDRKAVGIILLSMRDDGTFAIIDGQHRVEAAERNGVRALDAYVYLDLTLEQEADLYRKFGDSLKQTARDRFFAALAAGEPEATAINRMLEEHGLRVLNNSNSNTVKHTVSAVDALMKVAHLHGPQILRETLSLLVDAFDGEPRGYTGPAINGAAAFLARFSGNPHFNRKRLIRWMSKGGALEGTAAWQSKAMHVVALDSCDKSTAFGKALLALHDQGNVRDKLGSWTERHFKPETKAALTERIVKHATPAAQKVRREAAIKRSLEVSCNDCHAAKGQRCFGTTYTHIPRLRKAAAARKNAA